ncbi:TPA: hypothetical protein HA251_03560 [Candidatus Woesearchaeota archaeon]|nr:hypothetical protein [Candidatus Woesearchaeota archaeon]
MVDIVEGNFRPSLEEAIARRGKRPALGRVALPDGTTIPVRWLPNAVLASESDLDYMDELHLSIERAALEPGRFDSEELAWISDALNAIERRYSRDVRIISARPNDPPVPKHRRLTLFAERAPDAVYAYTVLREPQCDAAGRTVMMPRSHLYLARQSDDGSFLDNYLDDAVYILNPVPQFFFNRQSRLIDLMRSSYAKIKRETLENGLGFYPSAIDIADDR